ncbi:hypothetical protein LCGC14_1546900 [marine sediment metagenome]|uniref:Uncharacterized protein n=1 Tax=marine sediment metagenome TaxID=412755 RepID=A0A0F9L799_9ZZZZ
MLQAGLGGYKDVVGNQTIYDVSPIFYEPGFNIMFPLELVVPEADQIYILIKRRTDTSGNFDTLSSIRGFSVVTKDATTGENIPSLIRTASTQYGGWNSTELSVVINNSINIYNPTERVRVLDVFVKDGNANCITFRLTVDDSNKLFYYIPIGVNDVRNRPKFSAIGRTGIVSIKKASDTYMLISPFSSIYETEKLKASFSYPLNTIFYKKQETYNEEDFIFSFVGFSHSFVEECVSFMNIPNYSKVAVLLIDKYLYTNLTQTSEAVSLTIRANGVLSDINETFIIKFRI